MEYIQESLTSLRHFHSFIHPFARSFAHHLPFFFAFACFSAHNCNINNENQNQKTTSKSEASRAELSRTLPDWLGCFFRMWQASAHKSLKHKHLTSRHRLNASKVGAARMRYESIKRANTNTYTHHQGKRPNAKTKIKQIESEREGS